MLESLPLKWGKFPGDGGILDVIATKTVVPGLNSRGLELVLRSNLISKSRQSDMLTLTDR